MDEMDNVIGYIGGSCGGLMRDFHFEAQFEPGNYLIVTEMEWDTGMVNRDFIVSFYGQNLVDLVGMNRKDNYAKLIQKMASWYVLENLVKEDSGIQKQVL